MLAYMFDVAGVSYSTHRTLLRAELLPPNGGSLRCLVLRHFQDRDMVW